MLSDLQVMSERSSTGERLVEVVGSRNMYKNFYWAQYTISLRSMPLILNNNGTLNSKFVNICAIMLFLMCTKRIFYKCMQIIKIIRNSGPARERQHDISFFVSAIKKHLQTWNTNVKKNHLKVISLGLFNF